MKDVLYVTFTENGLKRCKMVAFSSEQEKAQAIARFRNQFAGKNNIHDLAFSVKNQYGIAVNALSNNSYDFLGK